MGAFFMEMLLKRSKRVDPDHMKREETGYIPWDRSLNETAFFCKLAYKAVAQCVFSHHEVLKRSWAEAPSGQQHSSRAGSRGDMLDTDDNHMGYIHSVLPQVTTATVPWQTRVVYMLIQTDI